MYECKLPFNPNKKFSTEFPNIDVKYLSKWELFTNTLPIPNETVLTNENNVILRLPTDKFDIHFRKKE